MKMVKSLLLGSAAGVVAVAGAQAADLPVKAKAVEYVKICSLYGAGFYYIPGTNICMKVGGYVRYQGNWTNGGASVSNGGAIGAGGRDTRLDSQDWESRTRAVATFDTREQTQYGVLRTYLLMGFQQDSTVAPNTSPTVYMTRGFIQIAGFTFGKAVSYYDFMNRAAIAYFAGPIYAADTGDGGQMLAAFTAQFGGGFSATISAEQSLRNPTVFVTNNVSSVAAAQTGAQNAYVLGAAPTGNILGQANVQNITGNPDIVANVRLDGTWGAFQLSGVLHDVSAGYFGTTETSGHPSNKWGWAIQPGIRLNAPMIGAGDYFQAVFSYTQGALKYVVNGNPAAGMLIWRGNSVGYGNTEDGVYGGNSGASIGIELTTAWSAAAAYEHFWTPALQTSLYGSYVKVSHNTNAVTGICLGNASSGTLPMSTPALGCNPDWSSYNIGSRTQWNIVKGLYVGFDVLYTKLVSASPNTAGTLAPTAANGAKGAVSTAQPYSVADQSAWAFAFRVQRDIVP